MCQLDFIFVYKNFLKKKNVKLSVFLLIFIMSSHDTIGVA